ncbi:MAG: hypothetical protein WAQ52_17475 [Terriglobales bacterium]
MRFLQLVSRSPAGQTSAHSAVSNTAIAVLYLLLLGSISFHAYRTPIYSMDALQYMGNATLMEETDPVKVHQRVYAEIDDRIPRIARGNLLGHQLGAPEDQNKSRQERATNPYRFAEFLPLFAIRPMYNIVLYWIGKTGLGLLRAGIVLSALSHYLLGVLFFRWLTKHLPHISILCIALLVMISPPIMSLGRENTADGLATLIALSALYLIFEKQSLCPGLALLLASIYFRTDFVVLAGPVLLALWWGRKIDFWQAGVLSALAVASVLAINHFAGDYGIKMLYYRNFVGTPSAPGEMAVNFSFRDYLGALRSGLTLAADSYLIPFMLLGTIGLVLHSRLRVVAAVAMAYVALHFVVLPNWDERWFGLFYLSMALCAATSRPQGLVRATSEQPVPAENGI